MRHVLRALIAAGVVAAAGVVVLAAPAGAVDVATDAELRAAWTNAATTEITLTADIDYACSGNPTRNSATAIVVDGAGHTLANPCAAQDGLLQINFGMVTIRDLVLSGNPASNFGVGPVVVDGLILSDHGFLGIVSFSAVTASDSSILRNDGAGVVGTSVSLTDTTVSDNGGNGVGSPGTVSTIRSTIADNLSDGIDADATVTLTASTVSGNGVSGIEASPVNVVNSTVTCNGNFGIAGADQTIAYSTITGNASINVSAIDLEIFATVLADGISCDVVNPVVSDGYNWASDVTCGLTGTGDVESPGGDPQLGALAANGGPTETQLPATTSPLVDTVPDADCQIGPAAGVSTDQRGDARPGAFTDGCDTGAVELQGTEPVVPTTTTTPGSTTPLSSTPGAASLPRTGTSVWVALALLGTGMLACGGSLVVTTVRRRRPVV